MIQQCNNGFLQFSDVALTTPFSSLLEARVGVVPKSKKEAMNYVEDGNFEMFVTSITGKSGHFEMYNLNTEWIRPPTGDKARIFCNAKTRSKTPFFCTKTPMAWDGSVIGFTPTEKARSEFCNGQDICDYLNNLDWFQLGCEDASGRKLFSVGTFQRMWLP